MDAWNRLFWYRSLSLIALITDKIGCIKRQWIYYESVKKVGINCNRKVKHPDRIGKIIMKLSDNVKLSQLSINNMNRFVCNPDNSYLIYGGTLDMWIDILEWLVFRDGKKVVISSKSKPEQVHVDRRLKLYQTYYNSKIMFLPADVSKDSISQLLTEVYKVGPIGAVFILPSSESESKSAEVKTIQYISSELQTTAPKALLINFNISATEICELRNDTGFLGYNMRWQDVEFSNVPYVLDDILRYNMKDIVLRDDKVTIEDSVESLYKKLNLLLPSSIDSLMKETIQAPKEPDFIQLPSLSTPKMREVPPIFIIPGIFNGKIVQDLARNLLYPVYCASFPVSWLPYNKIAANLAQKIKEICPSGPYNLLGISYGGPLATETANLLEKERNRVLLQYLDGAPDTIQGILKHLGEGKSNEVGLLCRVLNITNIQITKEIDNSIGWEARLNIALKHSECSLEDKLLLCEILTTFKKYLNEVSNFQPFKTLMSCQTCLLRPKDDNKDDYCGLLKYFEKEPRVYLIDGDYTSMLQNKTTAKIINNNAINNSYSDY
ncbi:hypothetical protein ILUMI_19233 [Ignelater luminosus]|uniref:oleoyl-[acyl-carrier-protein] hydrolase n=1 Tax=Ignelater luminosus TaxID=2038154 RepID=A0A8K0CGN2_IGNLU|nr:hypothetical protein ILUMI_19233 [Ignelater luminosus]